MNAQDLLDRAQRAAESAKLLLDAGDVNGACNRAYYAMFDAARAAPAKLKRDINFQPCPAESGDEHYQNGIFEFNITRLLAFIDTCAERFPIELVPVAEFPNFGGSHLDQEAVRIANLSRPILLAEIAPGLYNVIDGNHRLARARCDSVQAVPSRRVRCPDHVPFLTSAWAYEKYVEYWNSKLEDLPHAKASRKRRKGVA